MLFKEAVSKRILELCELNNYTPNRLAKLSTVPPSTLRATLANKINNPNSYVIYKICKTFKIGLKEFFNSSLFNSKNLEE